MAENLFCLEEDDCATPRRATEDLGLLNDSRVLQNLLMTEDRYMAPTSYYLFQKDILPYMRTTVGSWALGVCEEQDREEEVFPLAMNYFDRVLSVLHVKRNQLQLIASTCMFIASKVREARPMSAETIVRYTANSIRLDDLLEWEMVILMFLKWDTSSIMPHDFLHILTNHLPLSESKRSLALRHAQTLVTMCAIDGSFSVHPPSVVACSSLLSSVTGLLGRSDEGLGLDIVQLFHDLTSIDPECIRACCEQIEQTLSDHMLKAGSDRSDLVLATDAAIIYQKSTLSDASITVSTPTDVRDINLCQ